MKTVVRLPKPTGPTFSGADPTGTPRRHYHRRSHRGCQAGAANAWPKPNVVDRRADWEPPVRPVGRTAGQRTPIAGPAILGQSRDRHVTADHLTRRNARQRWRSSGANYGSQRPQIPLDPLRPLRDVPAGQWLFVRLPQTGSDPHALTGGQGVAGSNPAVPTRRRGPLIMGSAQVSGSVHVYALPHRPAYTTRSWGPSGDRLAVKCALRACPASVIDCASGCRYRCVVISEPCPAIFLSTWTGTPASAIQVSPV